MRFESALTGGEALDHAGSLRFNVALVAEQLGDLPSSMVMRTLKDSQPEALLLAFTGPGAAGKVDIVEGDRRITFVKEFTTLEDLTSRLDEVAETSRMRARELRYMQAFRERHYSLLRRFASLKQRLDQLG
jgi:hypothetical protein